MCGQLWQVSLIVISYLLTLAYVVYPVTALPSQEALFANNLPLAEDEPQDENQGKNLYYLRSKERFLVFLMALRGVLEGGCTKLVLGTMSGLRYLDRRTQGHKRQTSGG